MISSILLPNYFFSNFESGPNDYIFLFKCSLIRSNFLLYFSNLSYSNYIYLSLAFKIASLDDYDIKLLILSVNY